MIKTKLYIKSVNPKYTVFEKLSDLTGIKRYFDLKSKYDDTKPFRLKHAVNLDLIKESVFDILQNNSPSGWLSKTGTASSYKGLSLVYNPEFNSDDRTHQTIGSDTNDKTEFFYNKTEHLTIKKNTYFDTYSFRKISPIVTGNLLEFMNEFRLSPVRSRLAIIDANYYNDKTVDSFGWHKDESVFENLRINIPITVDPDCLFQMENSEPELLEYGNMYSWDTNLPHRVFARTKKDFQRIHIVLGFSPWFDYLEEEDAWVSNDFFGKKHPLDMLIEGDFHPKIKGIK